MLSVRPMNESRTQTEVRLPARSIFTDMVKYIPSHAFGIVAGFASVFALTRLFSPAIYANYAIVQSLLGLLECATAWITASFVRFHAEYRARNKDAALFWTSLLLRGICIAAVVTAAAIVTRAAPTVPAGLSLILGFGLAAFVCRDLYGGFTAMLRTERRLRLFTFFTMWQQGLSFVVGLVIIIWLGVGIHGMYIGSVASASAMLWLLFMKVRPRAQGQAGIRENLRLPVSREMFFYGFPIALNMLSWWILNWSDRFVIAHLCDTTQVGLYAAPYTLASRSFGFVAALFYMADRPLAMKIWARGDLDECRHFLTSLVRLYLMIGVPLVVLLSILAKAVMSVAVPAEFQAAYLVFPVVVAAEFLTGLALRFQITSLFYRKTGILVVFTFASGLINVFLNYLLIPRYGFTVAGLTTLAATILYASCNIALSLSLLRWRFPFRAAAGILAASAVMLLAVYLAIRFVPLPAFPTLALCAALALPVYAGALLLFGLADVREWIGFVRDLKNGMRR